MKACVSALAVGLAVYSLGQAPKTERVPEQAQFITERANEVSWNQVGTFLGYTYREKGAHLSEIGLYDLEHHRGKTLITSAVGEDFDEPIWLAGAPFQLAVSSQKTTINAKPAIRKTVYALDGGKLVAKKLWSEVFPETQNPTISVETSPSLTHAIVSVFTATTKAYYVVTLGAQDIVISPDISSAIQLGQGFAGWTIDGTAFFGGGSANDLSPNVVSLKFNLDRVVSSGSSNDDSNGVALDTAKLNLDAKQRTLTLVDGLLANFFRVARKTDIALGTEGLELMPSNGILRQVRFKGYWQDEDRPPMKTVLVPNDHELKYKQSTGGTKALWLTPNEKDPKVGILVSPQAELSWLHPDGQTVAFTVNGALFMRSVRALKVRGILPSR